MKTSSYVYIISNHKNGTIYVGVTTNIIKRIDEHKRKVIDGFSKKYGLNQLVWYEEHPDILSAISREKQLKKWNRAWKINLIENSNPEWRDLSLDLM